MQKWLIVPLGVLLSSCLSAAAQTPATQVLLIQAPSAPLMTLVRAAPTQLPLATFLPAPPLAERPARFNALLAAAYNRDSSPEPLSAVEVVKTPFVRQARVAVVQLWGGRLQLGGFVSTSRMENVLLGYSAPGGLAGFGVSGQGHPGVTVPHGNKSYGLSLTFRLGREGQTKPVPRDRGV